MLHYPATTIGFYLLFALTQPAGAQHLSWRNYTADQGLPGNEVYDMLHDSRGFLWFVTDQGICRFNGYEFTHPVDTSALRGSEAFLPTEGPDGRIWFTRLDGSVWFVENDTIREWQYNAVTAPYREAFKLIENLAIDSGGSVWITPVGLGIIEVAPCGAHRVLSHPSDKDEFILAEVAGRIIYTSQRIKEGPAGFPPIHTRFQRVWRYQAGQVQPLRQLPPPSAYHHTQRGVWKLSNGDLLFSFNGVFYLLRNDCVLWRSDIGIWAEKVRETPDGALLIAAHLGPKPGLHYFASPDQLRQGKGRNLLPGSFVTDVDIDREGGWWAATIQAGVWYCKNPGMEIFSVDSGLPSEDVLCLTSDGASTLWAGLRPVDLVAINAASGSVTQWSQLPFRSRGIDVLHFDTVHRRLWGGDPLSFWENGRWNTPILNANKYHIKGEVGVKTLARTPVGDAIWGASSQGFISINTETNEVAQIGGKNERLPFTRTFSVTPDAEGNLWITTPKGLMRWNGEDYEPPPFQHPALRFQPRHVAILPTGGMAISLRGAGLLIRDRQGNFTQCTQREGLSSDFISKLYCSSEGEIFACSHAGLNRLTPRKDGGWDIAVIDTKKGLPSNHVNDALPFAGAIWVATNRGLARFNTLPDPAPMPAPILEQLHINNILSDFVPDLRLPHFENTLSIRFFALHYRSEGDILYRYRLIGADTTFTHTGIREINFANLSPGRYTFEVQARGEDGVWSESTRLSFFIRAAWWQTTWFWAALVALLGGGLALWYRSRLQLERREAETNNKIRDLESAALRAQMNPHFIFNCLGSIQYFIAENDADAAARYLARFARLVRLALHGSVDGRHSLREEMEMLDNYLALEQLRFRGRFVYAIETDPDLDIDDISLPPMLIQPFVENALLHGMKNKAEGGRISISFSEAAGALVATIIDNGPGFATDGNHATDGGHKSVGMMLTQRRLEVLSDKPGEKTFLRENILAADGKVVGMRVMLRVTTG